MDYLIKGTTTKESISTRDTNFDYDCTVTPRVFAHIVSDSGIGARIGWWHFDQTAAAGATNSSANDQVGIGLRPDDGGTFATLRPDTGDTLAAGQTDVYNVRDRFVMDVWDFDITARMLNNERWNVTAGAGIRYADISKHLDATNNY